MFGNIAGAKQTFEYFECGSCGTIQISEIPLDLAKYYPSGYYSLAPSTNFKSPTALRRFKYAVLSTLRVPARSKLGKALGMKEFYNWLGRAHVRPNQSVVDFGSGAGHLLLEMFESGFEDLTGIDPYIERDIIYNDQVRVLRQNLPDIKEKYDVVMSHHSFEHVLDPRQVFAQLVDLLNPGGVLILRIPFLGWAWEHFGLDWVAFDAPRHLYHFSEQVIRGLGEKNFVELEDCFYDSFEIQFWASLQYQRGISLFDAKSYGQNPEAAGFSKVEIEQFKKQSAQLNKTRQGDQICYIFRKPTKSVV